MAFNYVEEWIWIGLLMRHFGAGSFRVSHGTICGKVIFLARHQKFKEVLVVMGVKLLIRFICGGKDGVECIHFHTALKTSGSLLAQNALHLKPLLLDHW